MNLKLVVASMGVLGLITVNFPVFAQDNSDATEATQSSKTMQTQANKKIAKHQHQHPQHKHHHHGSAKHLHHHLINVEREEVVYKDMPVEPVCTISNCTLVLDSMTQNLGRALPNPCVPGWFNRIAISGGIAVDLGKWGRNVAYMGENYQRLSLNDAYLNISAIVNDWAKAFASISYNTATINDPTNTSPKNHVSEYDAAYDDNITSGGSHRLQLEQAYATFANFNVSPFFAQVGKQFADFGRYPLHPITESMTQVMSKTLATAAKIGFIAHGFNGSVYVFDSPLNKVGQSKAPTVWGAALGFEVADDYLGWDVGVGYLSNLIGVNDIAYNVNQFNLNVQPAQIGGYHTRVAGLAIYADVNSGPFYLGARYTTALSRFNVNDLPSNGVADIVASTGLPETGTQGAKPWALGFQAAYGFSSFCDNPQTLYVGYQTSRQAAGLNLPNQRLLAGYSIDVWTNTNLAIQWDHDIGYLARKGGNGSVTNLVSLRAAVQFS